MANKYKPEHLAKEADRLLHDEILNHAIAGVRQECLEQLAEIPAEATNDIMRAQAVVKALAELNLTLNRYIIANGDST